MRILHEFDRLKARAVGKGVAFNADHTGWNRNSLNDRVGKGSFADSFQI